MSVYEKRFDQVRKGASFALWWFMMDWARRNGLRCFDLGASRAQTPNTTSNFKRQWGTRVVPERDVHAECVFYSEELPLRLRHHLNERGFVSEVDGSHYRVFLLGLGQGLADAELARERRFATRRGLDGILLISPRTNDGELSGPCSRFGISAHEGIT